MYILCMPNALQSNKSSALHMLCSVIDFNYLIAFEEDKQV